MIGQTISHYKVLEKIANRTSLVIDFGGGLKTDEDLRIAFESGTAMITGGSIAVKNREIFLSWIKKYGSYPDFVRKSWKTAKRIRSKTDSRQQTL